MSNPADNGITLPYAGENSHVRYLRRAATWGIAVATLCLIFGLAKAVAYGLLHGLTVQAAAVAEEPAGRWSGALRLGSAVELAGFVIAGFWLAAMLKLRRSADVLLDASRVLGRSRIMLIVQLGLLGLAAGLGARGVQLWGSGLCAIACALLAWRTRSAALPRDAAARLPTA
jgi:hypothetical protein